MGATADRIEPLITRSLHEIRAILGLDRCVVWQLQGDDSMVTRHVSASADLAPPPVQCVLQDQVPWLWSRLFAGQDVCSHAPEALPPEAAQDLVLLRRMWVGSHLIVPMRAEARVMGAFSCASVHPDFEWADRLRQRLGFVASIFAAALARKESHEALMERLQFEEVLSDLSAALSSVTPDGLHRAVEQMLGRTCRLLRCQLGALLEFTEDGAELNMTHLYFATGTPEVPSESRRVPPWHREQVRRGHILVLRNLPEDLPPEAVGERAWVEHFNVASHVTIPISVRSKVVGAIAVESVGEVRDWSDTLIGRLALVGELIGNALDWQRSEAALQEVRNSLAHVGRVLTVGELTAAIAHELNQPQTAIVSNAYAGKRLLARSAPDLAEIGDILRDVAADAIRAGEIIQRLRDFLRRGTLDVSPLDLGEAVEEVGRLVANEAGLRRVTLEVSVSRPLPLVAGDRVQLQQVLLNLAMNALEALECAADGPRCLAITCGPLDGQVVVTVEDTGPGVPDPGPRIFEAFVTTKRDGMGMGLSIARTIAHAHRGDLELVPRDGAGARFDLRLPCL